MLPTTTVFEAIDLPRRPISKSLIYGIPCELLLCQVNGKRPPRACPLELLAGLQLLHSWLAPEVDRKQADLEPSDVKKLQVKTYGPARLHHTPYSAQQP